MSGHSATPVFFNNNNNNNSNNNNSNISNFNPYKFLYVSCNIFINLQPASTIFPQLYSEHFFFYSIFFTKCKIILLFFLKSFMTHI